MSNSACSPAMLQSCHSLEPDFNEETEREREKLIDQVFQLQKTLDDLAYRVDSVREENIKLRSENQILGQYIENLMAASAVFQSTSSTTSKQNNYENACTVGYVCKASSCDVAKLEGEGCLWQARWAKQLKI